MSVLFVYMNYIQHIIYTYVYHIIYIFTCAHTFARFNISIESSSRSHVWFQLPKHPKTIHNHVNNLVRITWTEIHEN
jgi:hypothetical protein